MDETFYIPAGADAPAPRTRHICAHVYESITNPPLKYIQQCTGILNECTQNLRDSLALHKKIKR
jgi:hypothetical protein